jgi:NADPH:quinone reductase-like Zn-dependent oxidoreductase
LSGPAVSRPVVGGLLTASPAVGESLVSGSVAKSGRHSPAKRVIACSIHAGTYANVAQVEERHLAKVDVVGSIPIICSLHSSPKV